MAAFGAVTILMDTLHQHFLQPTPLFPLRNKTKVKLLYRNLSSLQCSLEKDFGFRVGEYDEAMKGLEAQLRDVSVELRFQIEHQLRLFYLGKSMKLRLHSAQKLLPILKEAIKGGIETMDFNSVMEILGKHFTLPVSGMPPHIYKRVKSFCRQHGHFLYGEQYEERTRYEEESEDDDEQESKNGQQIDDDDDDDESKNGQQIDDEQESKNGQQIDDDEQESKNGQQIDDDEQESKNGQQIDDDEQESKNGQQIDDDEQESKNEQQIDDDDDKECWLLLKIITLVWRVSSQIKKKVKSCFRRERKSDDDDEQESNNEQQIDDDEESEDDEQDSDDDDDDQEQESKNEQQIDDDEQDSGDEQDSKNEQQIDDEQDSDDEEESEDDKQDSDDDDEEEAERKQRMMMMYMLYEAESVIRQEVRASYLNKYMKQRILATQRIRQLFIHGISLTSSIKKHMLKVKNAAYHQSNNSQNNNNPSSLRGLELDNIPKLEVGVYSSCEPLDIWGLPQLKNISIRSITLVPPRSVHHNLESIRSLDYRSCTKELFLMIPNLRILKVTTNHKIKCKAPNWFESLVYLYKLEVLMVDAELGEFSTIYSMGMLSLENFWPSLKRLHLSNTNLKWEDMDVVGRLSKLEELRLMRYAIKDQIWKPKDGGFRRLKFLEIFWSPLQYWEATSNHFPVLEELDLSNIKLKEISSGFAEITTLKSIKLCGCLESLISSAERIQKEQQEYGNDTFVVHISGSVLFAFVSFNTIF
nr:putative disease resistance RPP13-like protein 3 [Ipomoea trifida]